MQQFSDTCSMVLCPVKRKHHGYRNLSYCCMKLKMSPLNLKLKIIYEMLIDFHTLVWEKVGHANLGRGGVWVRLMKYDCTVGDAEPHSANAISRLTVHSAQIYYIYNMK
jgi:hypothetical protein